LKIAAETKATVPHFEGRLSTAEEIASQHGVSRATVERAGQFAAAVDKLGLGAEVATGQVEASLLE
jgi:response regulator of citrate/malate metabolism